MLLVIILGYKPMGNFKIYINFSLLSTINIIL